MSAARRGMGRGLAAILPESHEVSEPSYRDVPVELIRPSDEQPRKAFDDDALARLADTIAESGVIQPLIVRPLSEVAGCVPVKLTSVRPDPVENGM